MRPALPDSKLLSLKPICKIFPCRGIIPKIQIGGDEEEDEGEYEDFPQVEFTNKIVVIACKLICRVTRGDVKNKIQN